MDLARHAFGATPFPIVVGAPKLGRYCVFGNLFARHNVDGVVHRLDRHPTMSVHPTTPSTTGWPGRTATPCTASVPVSDTTRAV